MKRKLTLSACLGLLAVLPSSAQFFTAGNLAVERIGDGTTALSSAAFPIFIDQYTTGGSLVNTVTIPSSNTGGATNALVVSGTATSEGQLTLSMDKSKLVLVGYNTNAGLAGVVGTTSASDPRGIATVDASGTYQLQSLTFANYSANNIRSGASDGTNNFWGAGPGSGVTYFGNNSAASGVFVVNGRVTQIFNGTNYYSTGSAPVGVYSLGPLPTSTVTAPPIILADGGASPSAYDFSFSPDNTVAYVCDDRSVANRGGVIRFTNGPTGYASNYTLSAGLSAGTRSLTVDYSGASPVIYAITADSSANKLVTVTDAGSASSFTTLATAPANEIFRGVRFAPQPLGFAATVSVPPADTFVSAGDDATFSVTAGGTAPFTYQWYSNDVAISYGTASTITITNATVAADGSSFFVAITNAFGGTTSATAVLHVTASLKPVIISMSPSNATISAGGSASFAVTATGADNYFWYHGAMALSDTGPYTGTGTATLHITGALAAQAGGYSVIASNIHGTATSDSVTLTVNDPVITAQPVGSTNFAGTSYTLNVTAVGTAPLTYAWFTNGSQDTSVDPSSSSYSFNNAQNQITPVYVVVSNALGSFTTSATTTFQITPYLIADDFNYPNGNITNSGNWFRHSGTVGDSFVTNGTYVTSQSRSDDVHRFFSVPQSSGQVYASFTVNMKTLPANAGGSYFAHFSDTNLTGGFFAHVFALTTNAFPGTYRIGVANEQSDKSTANATGPVYVVPLDLATNIPYQVVIMYDLDNNGSQVWVNPASPSDNTTPQAFDVGTFHPQLTGPLSCFDFRQAAGEGVAWNDNLRVALSFADVTTNVPVTPIIGLQPVGYTNYSGNNAFFEVAASGIGLHYDWQKDGVSLGAPDQPTLELDNLQAGDSGDYTVVVANTADTVTSAVAHVSIDGTLTQPFFTTQPTGVTNSVGSTAVLTAVAAGTGPLSYQWYVDHGSGPTAVGGASATTSRLVLSGLTVGDSGTYTLVAHSGGGAGDGTSAPAIVYVTPPKAVSVAFLRSLEDPVTTQPSDITTIYQVTGTITTFTNLTSGNTTSMYVQDATGGINVFVSGNSAFRPPQGAVISAAGVLSSFSGELELTLTDGNPAQPYALLTNLDGSTKTNALPAPQVLPLDYLTAAHVPYLISNLDGSVVMITNATLSNSAAIAGFVPNTTYTYTNGQGHIAVFVSLQVTNFAGTNVPPFVYSISGPLITNTTSGWEIELTRFSDMSTSAPSVVTVTAGGASANPVLTWPATPYGYAYTVLASPTVTGPYVPVGGTAISTAVVFTNGSGVFQGTNSSDTKFYEVVSP